MSTAAVLERAPEAAVNPEALYEVVRGTKVELPPMGVLSTLIASRLQEQLGPFARHRRLGTVVTEMLFIIDRDEDTRRRPDVAFVSAARWPLDREVPPEGDWDVIPDVAIEVVSPNDLFSRVLDKVSEYLEATVREVWVLVPNRRQVHIYSAQNQVRIIPDGESLESPAVFPGWRLPLSELFAQAAGSPAAK